MTALDQRRACKDLLESFMDRAIDDGAKSASAEIRAWKNCMAALDGLDQISRHLPPRGGFPG
jgi:hypothetical protein